MTTFSLIGGLQGSVPGTDWTWEAFLSHGISHTLSRQTGCYPLNRLRGVITAPNFRRNSSATGNSYGIDSARPRRSVSTFCAQTRGLAQAGTDNSGLPAHDLFHHDASYAVTQTARLRLDVDNLFDIKTPPTGAATLNF